MRKHVLFCNSDTPLTSCILSWPTNVWSDCLLLLSKWKLSHIDLQAGHYQKYFFRGKVKRSCETKKPCVVNSSTSKLSQLTNASDTTQIVVEAETPSSDCENIFSYFSFQMQLDLPSDYWMDIVLMSSKSPYQVDYKNLTEFIPIQGLLHYKIIQQLNFLHYDLILTTNHPYKRTPGQVMMDKSLEMYYSHYHVKYLWSQLTITTPISFSTARPNRYLNLHTLSQQSYFVFGIDLDHPILIAPYRPLKKYFSHFVPEKKKRHFTLIQVKWQSSLRPLNFSVTKCSMHINSRTQFVGCYNISSQDIIQTTVKYVHFMMLGRKLHWFSSQQSVDFNVYLMSWREASQLCKAAQGLLPSFTNVDQLHYFLDHLKSTTKISVSEAVFVGLKIVPHSGKNVRYFLAKHNHTEITNTFAHFCLLIQFQIPVYFAEMFSAGLGIR